MDQRKSYSERTAKLQARFPNGLAPEAVSVVRDPPAREQATQRAANAGERVNEAVRCEAASCVPAELAHASVQPSKASTWTP